jgi:Rps23 Pro-64 3,4-dihydroxylase Tpa1-like proline 4-hydroxylase
MKIDCIKEKGLYVLDDVMPVNVNHRLLDNSMQANYKIHKCSRYEPENDYYMVCPLSEQDLYSTEILPVVSDFFKNIDVEQYFLRSYVNMYTQWTPTSDHIDENEKGCFTVLFFFCNSWQRNWGGELTFYDVDGCNYTVEYQPNRMVIFDGTIVHRVNPVTSFAKGFRFSLAIKCASEKVATVNYSINNLIKF